MKTDMDSLDKKKQELIEKYWEGTTSLAEERVLKEMLTEEDGALYDFFNDLNNLTHKEIEIDVARIITESNEQAKPVRLFRLNNILAYAATVTLLLGAFTFYQSYQSAQPQLVDMETYDDPEQALEQTRAALAFVMNKMQKGQNETMQNVKKIGALNDIIPK